MSKYNCNKIKKIWNDGGNIDQMTAELKDHLSSCPGCQKEMYLWQSISTGLQGNAPIQAPDGFAARVTARIAREKYASNRRSSLITRLIWGVTKSQGVAFFSRYKYALTTGVACLIIVAVSFGFAAGDWWHLFNKGDKPQVVINNKGAESKNPGLQETTKGKDARNGKGTPPASNSSQIAMNKLQKEEKKELPANGNSVIDQANEKSNGASIRANKKVKKEDKGQTIVAALREPKVFLNHQSRIIESTLLKLSVADLSGVRQKVCSLAEARGITYYSFGQQQINGKKMEILRFVVPQNAGDSFIDQVMTNGKVLDREEEKRDISNQFAETLDQYQNLIARRNALEGQKAQELDQQITALEQQLTAWDKEAWQHIVVLWLVED